MARASVILQCHCHAVAQPLSALGIAPVYCHKQQSRNVHLAEPLDLHTINIHSGKLTACKLWQIRMTLPICRYKLNCVVMQDLFWQAGGSAGEFGSHGSRGPRLYEPLPAGRRVARRAASAGHKNPCLNCRFCLTTRLACGFDVMHCHALMPVLQQLKANMS